MTSVAGSASQCVQKRSAHAPSSRLMLNRDSQLGDRLTSITAHIRRREGACPWGAQTTTLLIHRHDADVTCSPPAIQEAANVIHLPSIPGQIDMRRESREQHHALDERVVVCGQHPDRDTSGCMLRSAATARDGTCHGCCCPFR